jgi:hypothetical protein
VAVAAVADTSAVEADTSVEEDTSAEADTSAGVRILGAAPTSEVERGILAAVRASAVEARVLIPEVRALHHSGRVNLK